MHFKKVLALLMAACLIFAAAGCKKESEEPSYVPANPNEEFILEIYAPSELMAVMTDVANRYSTTVAPRASVRITFDDGVIQTAKIEAGTPCDIYVSDDVRFMDWLDQECDEEKNPNKNDKIVSETRADVAYGPGNEKYAEEELAEGEVYNTTFTAAVCRATALPYEAE
ncbi:MAG: hypothetical protein II427_02965 [Firmicutes bacterium]|nr:hypothetical protein [Bacillota bacterium]